MAEFFNVWPELHFPVGEPFEVQDQFNGKTHGTWFYRSPYTDQVYGPYLTRSKAMFHIQFEHHNFQQGQS